MAALHTDIGQVGGVAERAGVRELILSHFLPASPDAVTDWAERAGQGFSGKTTAGHDGMRRSVRLWQYATGLGTYVSLDLADVHGPLECELIAVSKTGERRVVTGWVVGSPGDGVPGHPAHLLVQGGTAIPAAKLARFDVIVVNGKTLLSIPV